MSHVVCLGLATQDTIFVVSSHPEPDGRVVAGELVVAGGGPAATAAVALARLGVPVFIVGSVGDDEVGSVIRAGLERDGVDVSELAVVPGARSPQSSILVGAASASRAIVHYPGTLPPLAPSKRALELMRDADWVHVDHLGYRSAPSGVRLSIDGGNPIRGLDLAGVALYSPTETALERDFGSAEAALAAGAELVVVTRGEQGCRAYTTTEVIEAAASPMPDPISTLGAGDVFHGALLAALVRGSELAETLAFANECAAQSCRALDGRSGIPTLEEVRG